MEAFLAADEKLSEARRAVREAAAELEVVSPQTARDLVELDEWAAALRRRLAREARAAA